MHYKYSTVEMMVRLDGMQHYDNMEKERLALILTGCFALHSWYINILP